MSTRVPPLTIEPPCHPIPPTGKRVGHHNPPMRLVKDAADHQDRRAGRSAQRGDMRKGWLASCVLGFAALGFALLPEGRLGCADPMEHETSPDAAWILSLCRRPMLFAMPGGSSDAPDWVVLRDRSGSIRGVVGLEMVQLWWSMPNTTAQWKPDLVVVPLVAELPLVPASGPVSRWLQARVWRWRALLGLVPTSDMFR